MAVEFYTTPKPLPALDTPAPSVEFQDWLKPSPEIKNPSLYLINTRLWLNGLSRKYNRTVTIDTVPDKEWQQLFPQFDTFWFMGIYTPSEASKNHAKIWSHQSRYALPDLDPDKDVAASPFAIPEYSPSSLVAKNWNAWDRMVNKLHRFGKKVYIDFVPNHTALDHPIARQHPEYFIQGSEWQWQCNQNFYYPLVADDGRTYYLAHGKDPNYPEWADTLQLNYARPDVQDYMADVLWELSKHSDGVRCDMAMLLNPDTFLRTWGWCLSPQEVDYIKTHPFWHLKAASVKEQAAREGRDFDLLGEIYWDRDYLGQVFDYIYDQDFYHQLQNINAGASPSTLKPYLEYLFSRQPHQHRNALYIENHDEERASRIFGRNFSKAAAVLAGLIPDQLFLVNQGQESAFAIRPPMQISRFPDEIPDPETLQFYQRFLDLKHTQLFQQGTWSLASDVPGSNIIALKVVSPDGLNGAYICLNLSHNYSSSLIGSLTASSNVSMESLTHPDKSISPDTVRSNGLFIGLDPGEVQIAYFSNISQERHSRRSYRSNLESYAAD